MKSKFIYSIKKYIKNIKNFNNITFINFKEKVFYTIIFLLIFRIGSFIPIYGIKLSKILNNFSYINNENSIFKNLYNLFFKISLNRISIFSLGIIPYMSSSMFMQFISLIHPYFIRLKKNENSNFKSILNKYIYIFSLFFSIIHSFILVLNLDKFLYINNIIFPMLSLISGSMFLIWISEKITNFGIGNGKSIIIFLGIISSIPKNLFFLFDKLIKKNISIFSLIILFLIIYLLLYICIFIECSQRKILINYPKQYIFLKNFNKQSYSYLPIKINITGAMPIMFSINFIIFFEKIFNWIGLYFNINTLLYILNLFKLNKLINILIHILLIFLSCYIYTPLMFNSKETSENLKKSNAFILGIRPGNQTSDYINKIINKLIFLESFYIIFIYLIPELLKIFINLEINGSSILVSVLVIIEIITQIQTLMISKKYESLLKKII